MAEKYLKLSEVEQMISSVLAGDENLFYKYADEYELEDDSDEELAKCPMLAGWMHGRRFYEERIRNLKVYEW